MSDYTSHHEAPLTAVEDVTIVPGKGLEASMNGESRDVVDDLHSLNVTPVSWYNGSTHCKTTQYEPCYSRLFARR